MGDFMCFKNIIACSEICSDVDFEMISFELKGKVANSTWEIIGIYRAPNDDMLVIERSAARNLPTWNLTKRGIIGRDLNLNQAVWKGDSEKGSHFQTI